MQIVLAALGATACSADADPTAVDSTAEHKQTVVALVVPDASTVEDEESSSETETLTREEAQRFANYVHPARGLSAIDGKYPGIDLKGTPDGRVYVIGDSARSDEEGLIQRQSGVTAVKSRPLTAAERAEARQLAPPRQPKTRHLMGARLLQASAERPAAEVLTVLLRFEDRGAERFFHRLRKRVANGSVATRYDYRREREKLATTVQSEVRAYLDPIVAKLKDLGATIEYQCQSSECVNIQIPAGEVSRLTTIPELVRADLDAEGTDDAVDGETIRDGHQIAQFYVPGVRHYDGNGTVAATDIHVAQFESTGADDEHDIFRDSSPSSNPRFASRFICWNTGCYSQSNIDSSYEGDHATKVLGLLIGDLIDGQIPSVSESNRYKWSGYGNEARVHALYTSGANSNPRRIAAFDKISSGLSPAPHLLNHSSSNASTDSLCEGESALAEEANDVYEAGVAFFQSSGNNGNSSTTDCTVSDPGSAAGVFTVSQTGTACSGSADLDDVREDPISAWTSRGGTSSEGKGRHIIDGTAYGCRTRLPVVGGGIALEGNVPASSFSTPTIAGGAIDFIDFYKTEISDLIDDPGILYANLHVMGDREGSGSGWAGSNLYGAGRIHFRMWNAAGLDTPWFFRVGSTCVDDGTTVTLEVNDEQTISSDVEYLKAALWRYDPDHETGDYNDLLGLQLWDMDEDESLFIDLGYKSALHARSIQVGGKRVELRIHGYDVSVASSDSEGCGTNSARVYFALYYEDADRDDGDGPGCEVLPDTLFSGCP